MQSEEFRIAVEVQKNATNGLWSYISCIKRLRKAKIGKPNDKRTIMFSVLVWITRVESIMLKSNDEGGNKWRAKIMLQDSTHYLTVWIKDDQLDPFTECTVEEYASFSEIDRSKVQETFKKNCSIRICAVPLNLRIIALLCWLRAWICMGSHWYIYIYIHVYIYDISVSLSLSL